MLKIAIHTTPPGEWRFKEAVLPHPFTSLTWQGLVEDVKRFRQAMGGDLMHGWRDRLMDEACRQWGWDCTEEGEQPPTQLEIVGRQRWKELHEFAIAYPEQPTEQDKADAVAWLNLFDRRVPNFGCNCVHEWGKLRAEIAPDLTSREAFYIWTVRMHNRVSARIGKPQFPETLPE